MLLRARGGLLLAISLATVAGWAADGGGDQEIRGPANECELVNQLCKWAPQCAESHGGVHDLRSFLVTGVGGSGTSWVRASLRKKGLDAADESWGSLPPPPLLPPPERSPASPYASEEDELSFRRVASQRLRVNASLGRDGMVSWPARCWATDRQRHAMAAADEGHGLQVYQLTRAHSDFARAVA